MLLLLLRVLLAVGGWSASKDFWKATSVAPCMMIPEDEPKMKMVKIYHATSYRKGRTHLLGACEIYGLGGL